MLILQKNFTKLCFGFYCHITHGFWREIKLNSFLLTIESLVILSSNYFVQYQHARPF
jgi:hypothetical protein